jgi:hypothetical protein
VRGVAYKDGSGCADRDNRASSTVYGVFTHAPMKSEERVFRKI